MEKTAKQMCVVCQNVALREACRGGWTFSLLTELRIDAELVGSTSELRASALRLLSRIRALPSLARFCHISSLGVVPAPSAPMTTGTVVFTPHILSSSSVRPWELSCSFVLMLSVGTSTSLRYSLVVPFVHHHNVQLDSLEVCPTLTWDFPAPTGPDVPVL